ncbi:hypothetical protein A6V29_16570 [Blastococcus sp. CCUG 61487]|nr:hypothetical protein A6V29_16570 [Blastococcus sp. CCUG 61487]
MLELPEAGPADHLCWLHDDDAAFVDVVRGFLAGGLARGERLLCVGDRAVAALDDADGELGDVARLRADGVVETMTVAEAYAAAGGFAIDRQRAFYDAATRRAQADGHRGLRVVADLTEFATEPELLPELLRWEHVADELMASGSGMSALCTYRRDLPPESLAQVLAVHPRGNGAEHLTPFRLLAGDGHLALRGSVDTFSAGRLATLLAGTATDRAAVLDLTGLDFIDVAGCRALAGWAVALESGGARPELRGASPLVRRMWRILGLDAVAPVRFSEPPGARAYDRY